MRSAFQRAAIQLDEGSKAQGTGGMVLLDLGTGPLQIGVVALHQGDGQIGLACEVVMDARLGDAHIPCQIGIAEAVEPAHARRMLGRVQQGGFCINAHGSNLMRGAQTFKQKLCSLQRSFQISAELAGHFTARK